VPNHLFLRPLIEVLLQAGVPAKAIRVLVATGLHRPNLDAELDELIGDPWVLRTVRVENHYATKDEDHLLLGATATRGTVVRLDKRFVEADLKIATGLVEPHFMAGYSGGSKVIAPGLAHAETITTFHSARFMADPNAVNCQIEGNPLHEEQLEIVRMLGGALALNTVVDESRKLSFVNFGEIVASHVEAVAFVRNYAEVSVQQRFKTVVTSAAGYPLDRTYYQTVKGMVGPIDILEPGGRLIVASECSEGLGSAEFVEAQRRLLELGSDEFLRRILLKSHADIDEWADPDAAEADGGRYAPTLQHRLESCTARSHRRPVHRVGTLRGTRKHRSQRRPRRSRDPRGTVRGAILQTLGEVVSC
jgi:nickel-dependent lactate racemase